MSVASRPYHGRREERSMFPLHVSQHAAAVVVRISLTSPIEAPGCDLLTHLDQQQTILEWVKEQSQLPTQALMGKLGGR